MGRAQLPVCGAGEGLCGEKGPPKKLGVGCQSGFTFGGDPHRPVPMGATVGGAGRDGNPGGAPGGPHGEDTDPRGHVVVVPQLVPGATTRRPEGAAMTSSSSASSAAEPRTPFGLGDLRLGDVEPEPDASPVGRAMGAMGRVIGPGSGTATRVLGPGARLSCVGDARGF